MRRSFIVTLAAALLATTVVAAAQGVGTTTFSDVAPDSELGTAVTRMAVAGVINGKPGGIFDPSGGLTRAEFVKIANLLFHIDKPAETGFYDVTDTHWAYPYVMGAKQAGYIKGDDTGAFLPDQLVTREQVCAMVGRINGYQNILGLKFDIKDPVSDWARQDVENALACGLFTLDANGEFGATRPITRAETVLALVQYVPSATPAPTPTPTPTPSTPPSGGGGGGGGGGGDSTEPKHDPEEEECVGYLEKMVKTFGKMNLHEYTGDADVIKSANDLLDCLKDALAAHDKGTELTRDYLEDTYATQIDQFREQYKGMDSAQHNDIQIIIGELAPSYELKKVMDYFGIDI